MVLKCHNTIEDIPRMIDVLSFFSHHSFESAKAFINTYVQYYPMGPYIIRKTKSSIS